MRNLSSCVNWLRSIPFFVEGRPLVNFLQYLAQFPYFSCMKVEKNVTLIGHNWGFLAGVHVLREHPSWFDSLIILNTNNLPDGEVDRDRFSSSSALFLKYLQYDSFFLAFRSSLDLLKHWFPFPLLISALNVSYTPREKAELMAPFQTRQELGGLVAFPLMVPVRKSDKYAKDFRRARLFLATEWRKPTLLLYSDVSARFFMSVTCLHFKDGRGRIYSTDCSALYYLYFTYYCIRGRPRNSRFF